LLKVKVLLTCRKKKGRKDGTNQKQKRGELRETNSSNSTFSTRYRPKVDVLGDGFTFGHKSGGVHSLGPKVPENHFPAKPRNDRNWKIEAPDPPDTENRTLKTRGFNRNSKTWGSSPRKLRKCTRPRHPPLPINHVGLGCCGTFL